MKNYDTLTEAVNDLTVNGYTEDFNAYKDYVEAVYSKKQYAAKDLMVTQKYHFEGDTSPGNRTELLVIEANDGSKGTLVMSGSAEHNHDASMIRKIPVKNS